jgi:hypothetical protein
LHECRFVLARRERLPNAENAKPFGDLDDRETLRVKAPDPFFVLGFVPGVRESGRRGTDAVADRALTPTPAVGHQLARLGLIAGGVRWLGAILDFQPASGCLHAEFADALYPVAFHYLDSVDRPFISLLCTWHHEMALTARHESFHLTLKNI